LSPTVGVTLLAAESAPVADDILVAGPDTILAAPAGQRIVAGPGGEIIVRNGVVFVDGDRRGTVDVGADYFGKPIDAFDRHVRLDVGEYWLMGIHERSLDSRYFGPVSSDRLVGRAYPIY